MKRFTLPFRVVCDMVSLAVLHIICRFIIQDKRKFANVTTISKCPIKISEYFAYLNHILFGRKLAKIIPVCCVCVAGGKNERLCNKKTDQN